MNVCLVLSGTKVAGFLEEDVVFELRKIVGTNAEPLARLEDLPADAKTRFEAVTEGNIDLLICDAIPEDLAMRISTAGVTVVAEEYGDARGAIRRVMVGLAS
jgi:hypothetical protein